MKEKILYLCDGEVPGCKKTICYKEECEFPYCRHTSDINHAINFRKPRREGGNYMEKERPATQENVTGDETT